MPRGETWGYRGGGGQKIFSPKFNQIWCVSYSHEWLMHQRNPLGALGRNMVMWHIKLKGKGSITIRFLRERGDLRWRVIECVLVLTFESNRSMIVFGR